MRDFIFIDDVIRAILKTLKNKNTNGEIINIGSSKPIKIKSLINKICLLVGTGKPIFGKVKMRKDDILHLYPNINKAKKILNWQPKTNLNVGLKKLLSIIEMKNLVSVIINFHNGEKYLETCIKSVLNQKFENLEIILWDNASTDNSKNIVKKFQEKK